MKGNINIASWMLGATCAAILTASGPGAMGQTATTNFLTLTTFDYEILDPPTPDGRLRYSYPYQYYWGIPTDPPPVGLDTRAFYASYYLPEDYAFTNAMGQFTFDNTAYNQYIPGNPSAGYGLGFGGGLNWTNDATAFVSTNLEDYILQFDLRAEGIKAGLEEVNAEFQIRFDAPDDTIQPPDGDTDTDVLIQVNFGITIRSNWQHYSLTLDQGSPADGKTMRDFILYRSSLSDPRFGFNLHMPHDTFDYDWDNAVYIDNIRLDVIQKAPPPPEPPKVPFAIFDYNWDDRDIWGSWSGGQGWSGGAYAEYYVTNDAAGMGVGGSEAFVMAMDNTALEATPPPWAGGNTGGNGPADYTQFKSSNLADYQVRIDGRAEGLSSTALTVRGDMQLHFSAPDDTIQPPDADTDRDFIVRLDYSLQDMQTNWQTYVIGLNKATAGGGSKANFTAYYDKIDEVNFQVQITNPHTGVWGYDAYNLVVVDNFRLERLAAGNPPLRVSTTATDAVVSWDAPSTGTVILQYATDPAGPYTDLPGAVSGYSTSLASGPKFFRTLWVAPQE